MIFAKNLLTMRTLLLDNTYFPVKIVGWQKAMILLLTGRAEVVLDYQNRSIRSVDNVFALPMILKLNRRHQSSKNVRFSRMNVFLRDKCRCQYCAVGLPVKELTFDHIIPQSKGGATNWENIVTCCQSCNTKKGARTPKEAGMRLLKAPRRPNWSANLCLKLKEGDPEEWYDWIPGNRPGETLSMQKAQAV